MRPRARAEFADAADLHVHTTHSDGACSPSEVVRAAASLGLRALAITDHDTVSALEVARPEAVLAGVELIGGIEITSAFEDRELHILGFFVDDRDEDLVEMARRMRRDREARIAGMADRLRTLGLAVDLEALRRAFPRATLGRRHLADYLAKTGQVGDRREAFARYLGDDGPALVPKPRVPWDRSIGLIRGAGGVAGLAHPPYDLPMRSIAALRDGGLGSLEVEWPGLPADRSARWRSVADRLGLVPTAGSDFHAPDRPGRWLGAVATPWADLERLRGSRAPA